MVMKMEGISRSADFYDQAMLLDFTAGLLNVESTFIASKVETDCSAVIAINVILNNLTTLTSTIEKLAESVKDFDLSDSIIDNIIDRIVRSQDSLSSLYKNIVIMEKSIANIKELEAEHKSAIILINTLTNCFNILENVRDALITIQTFHQKPIGPNFSHVDSLVKYITSKND